MGGRLAEVNHSAHEEWFQRRPLASALSGGGGDAADAFFVDYDLATKGDSPLFERVNSVRVTAWVGFSHIRKPELFYDRFGAKQDLQSFYEDPAGERLIAHSGTGRHAERLLSAAGCERNSGAWTRAIGFLFTARREFCEYHARTWTT
jgi:hypothetical protein